MRREWLVVAVLFAGVCGCAPQGAAKGAAPGSGSSSRDDIVPESELPAELTFTIADATPPASPLTGVRTLRCELLSPHDISKFEVRFPRFEVPDGWTSLAGGLPFAGGVRSARRYTWFFDVERTSSSSPPAGDVRLTFRYGGPDERNVEETPSNTVRVEFPAGTEPHALAEADVARAAGQGFLLCVGEWGGTERSPFVRVRPDGRFHTLVTGKGDAVIENEGTLDAQARAELATLLRRIRIWELLTGESDELTPRSMSTDSLVSVALAVGDGCSQRGVLGSNMRKSAGWKSLTAFLAEHTGLAIPDE